MIESMTYTLAAAAVVGQLLAFVLLVEIVRVKKHHASPILTIVKRNAVLFAFFVASVATLGSLFFSEIAGYEPCTFCWYQRILMYPLVVIFGLALFSGARDSRVYGFVLSVVGVVVATYHYLMQTGVIAPTTCSDVGQAVSCSGTFTQTFGYITIPMMALTAFILIMLITLISRYYD